MPSPTDSTLRPRAPTRVTARSNLTPEPPRHGADEPAGAPVWRALARALVLPAVALAFILAGAIAWGLAERALANRIWYAGLILAGLPAVAGIARGMLRGHFATDVVAMLAIVTSAVLQQPFAGLIVVLMQTGGEALERYAEGRASAAVRALEAAAPREAHRLLPSGALEDVAADEVRRGDLVVVRPGELVPCDGVVAEGRSHVDTSRLTGEPVPLAAEPGVRLASGSLNGEGPLTVRVEAVARESQYARIVELVRTAQASKAPLQRLADRYAIWFTPATLIVCAIAWLASGDPQRVLAVLVVATPCPLILATPIAIIGGINRAAARQVIVRHGGALEQLATVDTALFDKTGTLTVGRPEVSRVVARAGWTERGLLRVAGAVEQQSSHLLARTLVDAAIARLDGEPLPRATGAREVPGLGIIGLVDGARIAVGARALVLAESASDARDALKALDASFTADEGLRAYVAVDGEVAGAVVYADRLRDDAADVLRRLGEMGVTRTILLSGDHEANVEAIARALGISEARGELRPEDKVSAVKSLVASGRRVLMVGDGTNDAPALSSATVGIAVAGSAGHGGGITTEAADIVLLADALGRVPETIAISRRTMRVARESLVAGLGLSAIAMVIAALGHIPPAAGALLQEAIDVAVIVNALRASR